MPNLVSLTLCEQPEERCSDDLYKELLSTLGTCLQQSAIEELCLYSFYDFPLSVLDNSKNIKTLTLSDCIAREEDIEPISTSGKSLDTLIIGGEKNLNLLFWTTRRATSLTTLELRGVAVYNYQAGVPELLTACSNSLTKLHLVVVHHCMLYPLFVSLKFIYPTGKDLFAYHINDQAFPFTLSALMCLKELSICVQRCDSEAKSDPALHCALPAILCLIKSAPSLPDVVLRFDRSIFSDPPPLDSSPLLDRVRSYFAATCPRIDLCIFDVVTLPDVLGVAEGHQNRDVVILKSEHLLNTPLDPSGVLLPT
jgi:hypothetical protein